MPEQLKIDLQQPTDQEYKEFLVEMIGTQELLRIGMQAGRALIEQPKPGRKRKDTRTMDLFGERNLF